MLRLLVASVSKRKFYMVTKHLMRRPIIDEDQLGSLPGLMFLITQLSKINAASRNSGAKEVGGLRAKESSGAPGGFRLARFR
jgi:hypothetical protein